MTTEGFTPRFVIVGSGRCGTTLLRALLNSTGRVFIPHESDFIARAFRYFKGRRDLSPRELAVATCLFSETAQSGGWGLTLGDLYRRLISSAPESIAELFSEVVSYYFQANQIVAPSWGLKTPVLIANLPRVKEVYPDAVIVHVVRDGRDVYLSYREVHEHAGTPFGPRGVVAAALFWVDAVRRADQTATGDKPACIRYEDLISRPQAVIDDLSRALGMSFGAVDTVAYGRCQTGKEYLLPEQASGIHAKVLAGIDPSNHSKWQKKMGGPSVWVFELIAAPQLRRYQYKLRHPYLLMWPFAAVRRPLHAFAHLFNVARYRAREARQYRLAVKNATALVQGVDGVEDRGPSKG